MAEYLDLQGNIHDDMGGTAQHLLPHGCRLLSQEELIVLRTPPAPTQEEIIKALTVKIQGVLDSEAQKLGYDNIVSACSYAAGTTANKYKTDGISFLNWRSNVWDYCYTLLADVQAQTVPMPTEEEIIAQLPVRV